MRPDEPPGLCVTQYEAFGNIVQSSGDSDNNRLANTKERDASIGLDNHGFRYYDSEIGRYTTRDPIGYGDGPNVYLSVHNNPINHVDPLGLLTPEFTDEEKKQITEKALELAEKTRTYRKIVTRGGVAQYDKQGNVVRETKQREHGVILYRDAENTLQFSKILVGEHRQIDLHKGRKKLKGIDPASVIGTIHTHPRDATFSGVRSVNIRGDTSGDVGAGFPKLAEDYPEARYHGVVMVGKKRTRYSELYYEDTPSHPGDKYLRASGDVLSGGMSRFKSVYEQVFLVKKAELVSRMEEGTAKIYRHLSLTDAAIAHNSAMGSALMTAARDKKGGIARYVHATVLRESAARQSTQEQERQ